MGPMDGVPAGRLGRPGRMKATTAARADVFAGAGCARRRCGSCSAVGSGSGDAEAVKLVAVNQNIGQAVFDDEV